METLTLVLTVLALSVLAVNNDLGRSVRTVMDRHAASWEQQVYGWLGVDLRVDPEYGAACGRIFHFLFEAAGTLTLIRGLLGAVRGLWALIIAATPRRRTGVAKTKSQ